jgi:hypothetical protein
MRAALRCLRVHLYLWSLYVTALQKTFAFTIFLIYSGVAIVLVGFAFWWTYPQTDGYKAFGVLAGIALTADARPVRHSRLFSCLERPGTRRRGSRRTEREDSERFGGLGVLPTALGSGLAAESSVKGNEEGCLLDLHLPRRR